MRREGGNPVELLDGLAEKAILNETLAEFITEIGIVERSVIVKHADPTGPVAEFILNGLRRRDHGILPGLEGLIERLIDSVDNVLGVQLARLFETPGGFGQEAGVLQLHAPLDERLRVVI